MPPTPILSTDDLAAARAAVADLPADSPARRLLAAYETLADEQVRAGLRRVTVWTRFDERPDRVRHRLAISTRRLEQLTLPDGEVRYRIGNRWFYREELEHKYSFERLPASYREFVSHRSLKGAACAEAQARTDQDPGRATVLCPEGHDTLGCDSASPRLCRPLERPAGGKAGIWRV